MGAPDTETPGRALRQPRLREGNRAGGELGHRSWGGRRVLSPRTLCHFLTDRWSRWAVDMVTRVRAAGNPVPPTTH